MASSKDASHIYRLTALLHIFVEAMIHTIRGSNALTISEIIPIQQMQAAKTVFRTMQHQKAIFLEAVEQHKAVDSIHSPRVSSFPQKISKALLSSQGPVKSVRNIHRVKGITAVDRTRIQANLHSGKISVLYEIASGLCTTSL
ncbi:uncharacterized protein LOC141905828 [Tubulanus polymorphus]|uniref:uncharacterized protein LOC141905828 n=1 Tax=Tubulanus polymorphus TaxID=672921 RepID=UPI003DA4DFA5